MNSFAIVALLAALALSTSAARFQRVEQAPNAPYPPAGYRPQGEQFRLPVRQFQQQQQQQQGNGGYVYAPPQVPEPEPTTETPEDSTTTTEYPTTTEPAAEELKQEVQVPVLAAAEFDDEGIYYIYHPDGLLQKVVYASKSEDMGYTAKLTYKDVEPIREPIYTYDPQTLVFTQVVF